MKIRFKVGFLIALASFTMWMIRSNISITIIAMVKREGNQPNVRINLIKVQHIISNLYKNSMDLVMIGVKATLVGFLAEGIMEVFFQLFLEVFYQKN